jgi:homoserine kinase
VRLTATVPATSANLGPGFDCFGLALDLCNEVTLDTGAEPGVTWEGEGAVELPTDGGDLVSRAVAETAARFERTPPPAAIHGHNRIPLERGLGSSAAAAVAGVALADVVLGLGLDRTAILEVAAGLEGHPDNAAAAVFGGFTIVVDEGVVARFDPDPELRPALFVPSDLAISTEAARRVLPDAVPRADAVANAGHAALVAIALLHEPDLLPAAMRDRVHEDVRLGLVPEVREVFERVRGGGLAVCVSGSGPTLLAFERHDVITPEPGDGWRVVRVPVRAAGVDIREG